MLLMAHMVIVICLGCAHFAEASHPLPGTTKEYCPAELRIRYTGTMGASRN